MRVYREAYTLVLTFSEILAGKFESWPLTNASKQKDVEEFAQARKHTHTRTHTHTHTHTLTHSLTHSLTHTLSKQKVVEDHSIYVRLILIIGSISDFSCDAPCW